MINDTLWPKLNTSLLRDLNLTQVKGEAGKRTKANFNTQQADKPIGNRGLFETQNGRGVSSPVTLLHNTTSDQFCECQVTHCHLPRMKPFVFKAS